MYFLYCCEKHKSRAVHLCLILFDSLWLSLQICLQIPCLAQKAHAWLGTSFLRSSTLIDVEEHPDVLFHTSNYRRMLIGSESEVWLDLSHLGNKEPDQEVDLAQPVAVLLLPAVPRTLLLCMHWGDVEGTQQVFILDC